MKAFYKFLDHTADIFFVAKAETLPGLFEQCALATEDTMVDVEKVKPQKKLKIMVEHAKIEGLLFDFLDELVFYMEEAAEGFSYCNKLFYAGLAPILPETREYNNSKIKFFWT